LYRLLKGSLISDYPFSNSHKLKSVPSRQTKARFVKPMLLLAAETLPEGEGWVYELKLDGDRALGIKTGGTVRLRSRNDKDFNRKYPTNRSGPRSGSYTWPGPASGSLRRAGCA
jgi:hypothetical protein